jgi:uncharacterized protein YlzI (FlbEa/FlbD family)
MRCPPTRSSRGDAIRVFTVKHAEIETLASMSFPDTTAAMLEGLSVTVNELFG